MKLNERLLHEAIKKHNIDVPVLRFEGVAPWKIKIWLLGGKVLEYQGKTPTPRKRKAARTPTARTTTTTRAKKGSHKKES